MAKSFGTDILIQAPDLKKAAAVYIEQLTAVVTVSKDRGDRIEAAEQPHLRSPRSGSVLNAC
jgi:hypothetical protein